MPEAESVTTPPASPVKSKSAALHQTIDKQLESKAERDQRIADVIAKRAAAAKLEADKIEEFEQRSAEVEAENDETPADDVIANEPAASVAASGDISDETAERFLSKVIEREEKKLLTQIEFQGELINILNDLVKTLHEDLKEAAKILEQIALILKMNK